MKRTRSGSKSKSKSRAKAKPKPAKAKPAAKAKRKAKPAARSTAKAKRKASSAARPAAKSKKRQASLAAKAKPKATPTAKATARARTRAKPKPPKTTRWEQFVEQHGVVLASAKGPVPSIAEEVAGEPIVGSWWSHRKGTAIFDALSSIDDSLDIRCFRLVDGKITFVHRRLWPALAALARAGVLDAERVTSIQQEHMPTGEHRNIATPFPDWAPEEVLAAADALDVEAAKAALGDWI